MTGRDIADRQDVEQLLRAFYARAFADDLLRPVFVDVVNMDLERHLPVITDFWEKVLLGSGAYAGRPLEVHRHVHRQVPLTEQHFDRWLRLWQESLEASFAGPVAERAGEQAHRIAGVLLRNLESPVDVTRPLSLSADGAPRSDVR